MTDVQANSQSRSPMWSSMPPLPPLPPLRPMWSFAKWCQVRQRIAGMWIRLLGLIYQYHASLHLRDQSSVAFVSLAEFFEQYRAWLPFIVLGFCSGMLGNKLYKIM